jgi:hypothetical protein
MENAQAFTCMSFITLHARQKKNAWYQKISFHFSFDSFHFRFAFRDSSRNFVDRALG